MRQRSSLPAGMCKPYPRTGDNVFFQLARGVKIENVKKYVSCLKYLYYLTLQPGIGPLMFEIIGR